MPDTTARSWFVTIPMILLALYLGPGAPLTAQACLGIPGAAGIARGVVTPTLGGGNGGTELGIAGGYAHATGAGARGRFASTRFGDGDGSRSMLGAEVAYDVAGLIPGVEPRQVSICPTVGFGHMSIGSLTETSFQLGVAAGGAIPLTEPADWTLHPYGTLGFLRASRSFETMNRSEGGAALRAGALAGYGRFVGGLEAEHGFVFAGDPSFRMRFGVRF